jgi:choline monooxygenase
MGAMADDGPEPRQGSVDMAGGYPATLPPAWYASERVFGLERERVFRRSWFLFAYEAQFGAAGDYVAGDVWGQAALVIRDAEGGLNGFLNCCRHRGGRLLLDGEGSCASKGGLRCRYHGWKYGFDGALRVAPGFAAGADFDFAEHGLRPVRVATWNGLVFVALSEEAGELHAWLGDIVDIAKSYPAIAELDFVTTVESEGAANWKLYGENGVEGYHLPFVHTWLLQAVGANAYEVEIHPNGQFVGFPVAYKAWGIDRPFKGYWILKYPGLLVHFSEVEFNCEQVIPLGVRHTRLRHWFWSKPNRPEIVENIARDWRTTMIEDMTVCEEVQRNIDVGAYAGGRLSPQRERGAIYFQSLVREALGDAEP